MGHAAEQQLTGNTVLVVDDDVDFRTIVAGMLARNGLTVDTAESAEEAIRRCRAQAPSLIVMDVWMPGQSGLHACTMLRTSPATASVPVILMSAQWRDEQHVAQAFDAGASDVIAKERSGMELMARVRSALAQSSVSLGRPHAELAESGLPELLAVCAACRRVRNESDEWEEITSYLRRVADIELTHGICPPCRDTLYGRAGMPMEKPKDGSPRRD
jgi:DNA-binding response OmpR family regulator